MTRVEPSRALSALLCALCGCLEVPAAGGPAAERHALELSARDLRGEPAALDALPRRPVLAIEHPLGFAGLDAVVLLSGRADEALAADLGSAPLRAEHAARLVAVEAELGAKAIRLTPQAALSPAADYTLAVFGSAETASGEALLDDRAPRLIALRTSGAPDAGAAVSRTFPADGASGIAVNLAFAVIAFDGKVLGAQDGLWLEDAAGRAVPSNVEDGPCEPLGMRAFGAGHCARITPSASLAPLAEYALVVGEAARDAHGGAVGPFRARLRTGTGRDERLPATLPLACALDELAVEAGCALLDDHALRLRAQTDEPVLAMLEVDGAEASAVADQGELELGLSALPPDAPVPAALTLTDLAGNARTLALALRTTPALATVSIDEVRADPRGPEPAQEYVELHNYGASAVELLGLAITDDALEPGVAIDRALRLDPGARALLVASTFDAADERDGALPPGVTLLRAPGAIAGSGLSNAGEPLLLRDAQGRRLSGAPATPKPRAGTCLQRIVDDPRDARPEAFAYDAVGGCTPGW